MAYVEVDVDMDNFDTQELIDELISRIKRKSGLKRKQIDNDKLRELKEELIGINTTDGVKLLEEQLKYEHFNKVKDKYRYYEIEKALPE